MFTTIKAILPNMVMCSVNETKIKEAYEAGITPDQIINYLAKNLHPSVVVRKESDAKSSNKKEKFHEELALPENVKKQLLMWHIH